MTDKAMKLARECGIEFASGDKRSLYYAYKEEIIDFYNLAQAAALREAAEISDQQDRVGMTGETLRRMAERKEK